jgi:hypothetical protein
VCEARGYEREEVENMIVLLNDKWSWGSVRSYSFAIGALEPQKVVEYDLVFMSSSYLFQVIQCCGHSPSSSLK